MNKILIPKSDSVKNVYSVIKQVKTEYCDFDGVTIQTKVIKKLLNILSKKDNVSFLLIPEFTFKHYEPYEKTYSLISQDALLINYGFGECSLLHQFTEEPKTKFTFG